ncbi:MFS transporter [Saccharothrix sp. HUAS TT1]|uniref:MFS transporter n=1 Tax=unclassified Saccharothrix TaxID=2593673 RepID=UPI00345C06E0
MADEPFLGTGSTRWWTLVAASIATFLVMLDGTAALLALPGLVAEFDAGPGARQWVVVAHTAPLAAFLLTGGALADRFGHRPAFRLGALLFTAGSVAAGAAGTLPLLVTARGFQGVGSALLLATSSALVAHEFPGATRSRTLATAAVLGLALGPVTGGVLAEADWRLVFLSVLPAGALLQAIGQVRLPTTRPTAPAAVDWAGTALFAACAALVVLGLTGASTLTAFAVAAFLLLLFLLVQRARDDEAMLNLALFGNRSFLGVSLATFASGAVGAVTVFLAVLHLQDAHGHTPLDVGARLLPLTLAMIGAAALARRFAPELPPRAAVGVAALLTTAGAGLLTLVGPDSTWLALLPGVVAAGAGAGVGIPLHHHLSTRATDPAAIVTATRINGTCHHLGVTAGISALFPYRVVIEQQRLAAASLNLIALTCAVLGGIFALIAVTQIHRRDLHDRATGG